MVNQDTVGEAIPLGKQKYAELNDDDFIQMKECWAVEYPSFRRVYDAYKAFANPTNQRVRHRIRRRTPIPSMADWEPDSRLEFTAKQLSMCKISPVIKVCITLLYNSYVYNV